MQHPSVSWHKSVWKFLTETVYALDKNSPSMYNFQTFGCPNDESSSNSSCHFWNHNVRVSQILHHCSVPWEITPLFFLAQTSYTLDKNSPLEWNFWTFEWLGENSPNSSCHLWNHKSVFLLNLAQIFNAMGDKSSVLF